ncbi:unnamed protein product [Phyllotreta striolata]|uniref:snRNA-activating protein complex subunit 4 n=1 Tax=Phyllotreta striolata TaxID=444603 RepID=A0A9N9TLJ3_PHYSR|nr:unnamed protein product [Phyllotreta striolata]
MDDTSDLKRLASFLEKCRGEDSDEDFTLPDFIQLSDTDEDEEDDDDVSSIGIPSFEQTEPTCNLQIEELRIVQSCDDPDLKQLLLLNRQKHIQLLRLFKMFKDAYLECKLNLTEMGDANESPKRHKQSTGSWRVIAPYFKDKDFFRSPPNEDALAKKANKELSTYDLMPMKFWSKYEKDKLISAVKCYYTNNVIVELKKRVRTFNVEGMTNEQLVQLDNIKMELDELEDPNNERVPPLGSDLDINWIRVSDYFLNENHSEFECRSFWHIYLHPLINKGDWSKEEQDRLAKAAEKYQLRNWDAIADELRTNRTGYIVAKRYFSTVEVGKKGEFSPKEDKKILELVEKYRTGSKIPWCRIARHFKHRSRNQLHHRYTYYLNRADKLKGKFCLIEDTMILLAVDKFGTDFKQCARYLPERSATQIKDRYTSYLRGNLVKMIWTEDEDRIIVQHAKANENNTNFWGQLTGTLSRTRAQIRQRYGVIKAFLAANPTAGIEDVPRRKHYHKVDNSYQFARYTADYFRKVRPTVLPTMEEIREVLDLCNVYQYSDTLNIDDGNIDDCITDFFYERYQDRFIDAAAAATSETARIDDLKTVADQFEALLIVLGVELNIPDDYASMESLDRLDKTVLGELIRRGHLRRTGRTVKRLVPPNFHTATAMRLLLVNYLHYKDAAMAGRKALAFKTETIFGNPEIYATTDANGAFKERTVREDGSIESRVSADRTLFYDRFVALFKWPAILTLQAPLCEFSQMVMSLDVPAFRGPVKRTYGGKTDRSNANKVRVLDEQGVKSLRLTPVTKRSVIADLLKRGDKKLYQMNRVADDGGTRTCIEEIDLRGDSGERFASGIKERFVCKVKTYSRRARGVAVGELEGASNGEGGVKVKEECCEGPSTSKGCGWCRNGENCSTCRS